METFLQLTGAGIFAFGVFAGIALLAYAMGKAW